MTQQRTRLENTFPKLRTTVYNVASPRDTDYNCIAFAAGEDDVWWWPDQSGLYYWPPTIPRNEAVESFIQAFASIGYEPCANGELEQSFAKIALYAENNIVKHVAKQIDDGLWCSKLGTWEDINHELEGLTGSSYGNVLMFLRRPSASL